MSDPIFSSLGFDGFPQVLCDSEYDDLTNAELAAMFGVSDRTIANWKKKVDWQQILEMRRKKYADKTARVDCAVFKSACKGDTNAAKLWYERFDNYIPATQQFTNHSLDESLIDDELKRLSERRLAAASAIAESGPVDAAGRGEIQGASDGEGEKAAG